jgi:hypothetical protein
MIWALDSLLEIKEKRATTDFSGQRRFILQQRR